MCAKHTDSEFEDVTARNYNKLSKTTTKVSYSHLFRQKHFTILKQNTILRFTGVSCSFCSKCIFSKCLERLNL